jgi:hypothetical protein
VFIVVVGAEVFVMVFGAEVVVVVVGAGVVVVVVGTVVVVVVDAEVVVVVFVAEAVSREKISFVPIQYSKSDRRGGRVIALVSTKEARSIIMHITFISQDSSSQSKKADIDDDEKNRDKTTQKHH